MKKNTFLHVAFLCLLGNISTAQLNSNIQMPTSINTDGSDPDNSAMLDIKSTTKGILIPRMTEAEMKMIASPVEGLLIFNTDEQAFFFHKNGGWSELGKEPDVPTVLADNDDDTKIQVEESSDEDVIRLDLGGTEKLVFQNNADGRARLEFTNNGFNVLIGEASGSNITTGIANTFIGDEAGKNNISGTSNTFVGANAGIMHTTGTNNTFIGQAAGYSHTAGDNNTFIGDNAGSHTTMGGDNTFVGTAAGVFNTTGINNTFVGRNAGRKNSIGPNNVFIGQQTGYSNTTGSANTFIGQNAGYDNTTGLRNTFIGKDAGPNNTNGNWNTFIGQAAGQSNTTGFGNVFIGDVAGQTNTTGEFNVFLGGDAGLLNTTGEHNTYLGTGAGSNNSTGSGNVFIGYSVGDNELGSNKFYLDNSDTASPLLFGEFDNDLLRINGDLEVGNERFADAGVNTLSLAADFVPTNVAFDIGNNNMTEHWDDIVGDDFINFSDRSQKRNIQTLHYGLAAIAQLKPITYQYLHEPDFAKPSLGLIAQEVLEVIPEVVKTHEIDIDENGELVQTPVEILGVNYVELIPLLIKGIQEQQVVINTQSVKIEQQQISIHQLQQRLQKLEQGRY